MKVKEHRRNLRMSIRRLNRARRLYVRLRKPWLEQDKERIYDLADEMRRVGLYTASGTNDSARIGIIVILAKLDGCREYREKQAWLQRTGWVGFHGWWGSKRRRAKEERMRATA